MTAEITHGFQYKTGVIHGRFQVLHKDHMKYLSAGKALCDHLVIGITNPDPHRMRDEASDPGRTAPGANPLTYYERYLMIQAAMHEAGYGFEQFSIVPLPINFPELYAFYVPVDGVFFISIYDDWGRRKLQYFKDLGLKTHVLWEVMPEQKGMSATRIRDKMIKNQPWDQDVPDSAAGLLKKWDIPKRLQKQ